MLFLAQSTPRVLEKPSAAHSCSFHPLNIGVHADRLRTKTTSPYVPKGWLVPTPGSQPSSRTEQQSCTSASHNSSTCSAMPRRLENSEIGFQESSLTLKQTSMRRLGKKEIFQSYLSKWAYGVSFLQMDSKPA